MHDSQSTENLFSEIRTILDNATSALQNGGTLDISQLDNKVHQFCKSINNLPAEKALEYRKQLPEIITYLNSVVNEMTARKNAISDEVDSLDTRQRAQNAYNKTALYKLED
jgi:hypothetical protein